VKQNTDIILKLFRVIFYMWPRLKLLQNYFSCWNYLKIISEIYCSLLIFSNMF